MMLHKREVMRTCFAGFDYNAVAGFGPDDVERILATPGMIRSRRKIEAIINNAQCFQRCARSSAALTPISGAWPAAPRSSTTSTPTVGFR